MPADIQLNATTNPPFSACCGSLGKEIVHFLSDPNEAPPYEYQDRSITGIGFWLMYGARFAISVYNESSTYPSCLEQTAEKIKAIAIGTLSLPFTIIGAVIKGIGSQFPLKVGPLHIDAIPKTPTHKIDQIYALLNIVSSLFNENNIPYSMDGGTLLGAVRHRGIIPWDDDGDLIVRDNDRAKILKLKDLLQEQGVILQVTQSGDLHLCFDAQTLETTFQTTEKAAHLDIFFMEECLNGEIRPKSEFFKHQWPKEYFLSGELSQLKDYPFGPPEKGLTLKGPTNPMRYLHTFYGPECLEFAIQTHSHIQIGPICVPILNFSKTRYAIGDNPAFAQGILWKTTTGET